MPSQPPAASPNPVTWTDPLPHDLTIGPPRPLAYRLELRNDAGRSAGYSAPAFVAAGAAPPAVEAFTAGGVRPGILLRWTPRPGEGEVLLERTQLDPPPNTASGGPGRPRAAGDITAVHRGRRGAARASTPEEGTVWLQAEPGNTAASQTIDGTITEGVRYRYTAIRRIMAAVGGGTLELRSAPSIPVEIAWRDAYPPSSPEGLTAVGFMTGDGAGQAASRYAVDLIWQPGTDLRVIGYLVSRVPVSAEGTATGAGERLAPKPVTGPAFHDDTARADLNYRYEVSAVDAKGNTSPPATATVRARGH